MLKKETAEMLGKVLPTGISVEELTKAITSENEVDLTIPQGRFLTKENEATLLDNHGKKKYDEGGLVKTEILLKELSREAGFDKIIKDGSEFLTAYKDLVLKDVKVEPSKKVEELENSLSTLRDKYDQDISSKDEAINALNNQLQGISTDSKIKESIPSLKDGVSKEDVLALYKVNYTIKEDGIYKGENLLKDDLQNPLTIEQSLNSFLTERDWIKKDISGNGGKKPIGSSSTVKNYSEYVKVCESKGWNIAGQEARQYLKEVQTKNADFSLDD